MAETGNSDGAHQLAEHVAARGSYRLESLERFFGFTGMAAVEVSQPSDLIVFLCGRCAAQLNGCGLPVLAGCAGIDERIDADQWQLAGVLLVLVQEALRLNFATLVLGLHRSEHPATLIDA